MNTKPVDRLLTLEEEFLLTSEVTDDYIAYMDGEITTEEYLERARQRMERIFGSKHEQ